MVNERIIIVIIGLWLALLWCMPEEAVNKDKQALTIKGMIDSMPILTPLPASPPNNGISATTMAQKGIQLEFNQQDLQGIVYWVSRQGNVLLLNAQTQDYQLLANNGELQQAPDNLAPDEFVVRDMTIYRVPMKLPTHISKLYFLWPKHVWQRLQQAVQENGGDSGTYQVSHVGQQLKFTLNKQFLKGQPLAHQSVEIIL